VIKYYVKEKRAGVILVIELIIEFFADIAEAFLDRWINKVVVKFKKKS